MRKYLSNLYNTIRCIFPEFILRPTIRADGYRKITGISGVRNPIVIVKIQIPFSGLNLYLDVEFFVLEDEVPTLMSMTDIIMNGLYSSVQGEYV